MVIKETGKVNEYLEPCLFIQFENGKSVEFTIDTGFNGSLCLPLYLVKEIDTGFNGSLCLPLYLVKELDLEIITEVEIFGVGKHREIISMAIAKIIWFGQLTEIEVLFNDGDDQLLGSELLADKILTIN